MRDKYLQLSGSSFIYPEPVVLLAMVTHSAYLDLIDVCHFPSAVTGYLRKSPSRRKGLFWLLESVCSCSIPLLWVWSRADHQGSRCMVELRSSPQSRKQRQETKGPWKPRTSVSSAFNYLIACFYSSALVIQSPFNSTTRWGPRLKGINLWRCSISKPQ